MLRQCTLLSSYQMPSLTVADAGNQKLILCSTYQTLAFWLGLLPGFHVFLQPLCMRTIRLLRLQCTACHMRCGAGKLQRASNATFLTCGLAFGELIKYGVEVAKVEGEQSNRMVDDFSRAELTEGLSTQATSLTYFIDPA